uniref:Uncharacterized protein n=1 Tax=Rhizophora mucronata TaxID=61149 RepID=A0A2P2J1Y1_RHIMU
MFWTFFGHKLLLSCKNATCRPTFSTW